LNFSSTRGQTGVKRLLLAYGLVSTLLYSSAAVQARTAPAPSDAGLQNPIYQPLPSGAGPETNDGGDDVQKPAAANQEELAKTSAELNSEELSDLWDAALANNPDIQFIIEKMTPKKSSIKSGGVVKDLSHAMYGCVLSGEGVANAAAKQSAGTQLIMDVLSDKQSKEDKKQGTKESDAIVLFKMIRDTAHKLTTHFYNYKKFMNGLDRANLDLIDLTAMVADTREKVNSSHASELDYLLRKQQRDIEAIQISMERCHHELAVLCGQNAVSKLDVRIAENISLSRRTAVRVVRPVFTMPDSPESSGSN
jgi:hypothetical protein